MAFLCFSNGRRIKKSNETYVYRHSRLTHNNVFFFGISLCHVFSMSSWAEFPRCSRVIPEPKTHHKINTWHVPSKQKLNTSTAAVFHWMSKSICCIQHNKGLQLALALSRPLLTTTPTKIYLYIYIYSKGNPWLYV